MDLVRNNIQMVINILDVLKIILNLDEENIFFMKRTIHMKESGMRVRDTE